ncbi:citrate synthase [Paraburkholderia silvatlantica]|uniref:citrate synthase n=1 Tax=Paraburkholderia silvatlantica TaxID=321895 RepID=UPI001FAF4230|nr:citrate synthase [Paraburkholderia silvatlantica]
MINVSSMMDDKTLYMTAEEASRALGVSVATLYAYVSRKQIRSERVPGSKARRYWKADVDRLRGRDISTADGTFETPVPAETSITLITEDCLYFRGRSAIELAATSTLESLAALIWEADEKEIFGGPAPHMPPTLAALQTPLRDCSLSERCFASFPLIERADPRSYDLSGAGYRRTAADVLRWFAALVGRSTPSSQPVHHFLAKALRAPKGFDEIIRTLLVLSADHEFDPITYAVRASANVGITPYQAVLAGLIAGQGRRFQAERYGSCSRFLQEILNGKNGGDAVVARLRSAQPLAGFASPRSRPDPRTAPMMEVIGQVLGRDRDFIRLVHAQQAALEVGSPMDFILTTLFVGHKLGITGEEYAITSVGRIVGWIAHAMEQQLHGELVRPRARYVGRLP